MAGPRLSSHDAEHGLVVIMVFATCVGLWACLPPPIGLGVPLIPSRSRCGSAPPIDPIARATRPPQCEPTTANASYEHRSPHDTTPHDTILDSEPSNNGSDVGNASTTNTVAQQLGGVPIEGVLAAGLTLPLLYAMWVSFSRERSARQRSLAFVIVSTFAIGLGYRRHEPELLEVSRYFLPGLEVAIGGAFMLATHQRSTTHHTPLH